MKKITTLFLVISLAATYCSKDEDEEDTTSTTTELEGTWLRPCEDRTGGTVDDRKHRKYAGNAVTFQTYQYTTTDGTCGGSASLKSGALDATGTFTIGSGTTSVANAKTLDITISSVTAGTGVSAGDSAKDIFVLSGTNITFGSECSTDIGCAAYQTSLDGDVWVKQ